jgi:hypothetical protein
MSKTNGYDNCDFCQTETLGKELLYGDAWGVSGYMCPVCSEALSEWYMSGDEDSLYGLSPRTTSTTPYGTSSIVDEFEPSWPMHSNVTAIPGPSTKPIDPPCRHHLTPFNIAGTDVYLSGVSHIKEPPVGPSPNACAYLSDAWLSGQTFTNDGTSTQESGQPRILFLDWPDYGTIPLEQFLSALDWAIGVIDSGEYLEIGCHGGHGRTGTFAAALAVMYGEKANHAINRIREEYCKKAVENIAQEDFVREVGIRINNEPRTIIPVRPEVTKAKEPVKATNYTNFTNKFGGAYNAR